MLHGLGGNSVGGGTKQSKFKSNLWALSSTFYLNRVAKPEAELSAAEKPHPFAKPHELDLKC
jgi:hypothetical protein